MTIIGCNMTQALSDSPLAHPVIAVAVIRLRSTPRNQCIASLVLNIPAVFVWNLLLSACCTRRCRGDGAHNVSPGHADW